MAILYAVQSMDVWRHLQIFTDSLTSLRLIRRWVFCPRQLKEDDRVDLFDGIGEAMATREGNTKPHKVKAHADNEGNETVEQPGPRKRQDASRTAEGCGTRESGPELQKGEIMYEARTQGPNGETIVVDHPTRQLRGPISDWVMRKYRYKTTVLVAHVD